MEFLRPTSWPEALAAKAAHPDALPLAGGTDVMVELNFDRRRPERLLDLGRVAELFEFARDAGGSGGGTVHGAGDVNGAGGVNPAGVAGTGTGEVRGRLGAGPRGAGRWVRLGAAVPYRVIIDELRGELPALALAAHSVASPQIRNRGSVGGNLGTASPAGDAHPALLAAGARIEVASVRGTRLVDVDDFYTGVKRNALAPDELIRAVHVQRASGPQQFAKVGPRNAMVIAVCAVALALHPARRTVRTGIGSAAPTPVRARGAEEFLTGVLDEHRAWERAAALPEPAVRRFGELCADACRPIDDVRASAAYRRHAVAVLARRTLDRTWEAYRADPRGAGGAG